jgi:hypothetical protein
MVSFEEIYIYFIIFFTSGKQKDSMVMWALVYWVVAVILALAVVLLGKCDDFVDAFAWFTPQIWG